MKITQGMLMIPDIERMAVGRQTDVTLKQANDSFGSYLNNAIADVNSLQKDAGTAVGKMVSGETSDLHEVMIAVEKARTSFDLLMEIRNKTIDMYREVMRMSV